MSLLPVLLVCERDSISALLTEAEHRAVNVLRGILYYALDYSVTVEDYRRMVADLNQVGHDLEEFKRYGLNQDNIRYEADGSINTFDLRYNSQKIVDNVMQRLSRVFYAGDVLVLLKQYIRQLLAVLYSKENNVISWSTVDSMFWASDNGCADIMYTESGYHPVLPGDTFVAATFRFCDPYIDLRHFLPALKERAILVFEGLRGVQKATEEEKDNPWNQPSQVHELMRLGILIPLSANIPGPYSMDHHRTAELTEYVSTPTDDRGRVYYVFLFDPNRTATPDTIQNLKSVPMVTRDNIKGSCSTYHSSHERDVSTPAVF